MYSRRGASWIFPQFGAVYVCRGRWLFKISLKKQYFVREGRSLILSLPCEALFRSRYLIWDASAVRHQDTKSRGIFLSASTTNIPHLQSGKENGLSTWYQSVQGTNDFFLSRYVCRVLDWQALGGITWFEQSLRSLLLWRIESKRAV